MNIRKIAGFAIGPIGGALLGFITLPIISWYFSMEDIGRISYLNTIVGLSILLFSLGLDQAYVRFFHEFEKKIILFKISIIPGLILILIVLLLLLSNNLISKKIFEEDSLILSVSVALIIFFSFLSRFFSLILRMNEKGLAYSMSQILPKLILIIFLIYFILCNIENSLTNLVLINLVSVGFVSLFYIWNTRKFWISENKEIINYDLLKEMIKYGFPLIFGGIAFWLLIATDKILLKELANFKELGLYSMSVSFAAAATILQSIFSTIWAPIVYKWAKEDINMENIKIVQKFVLMAVIFIFCLAGMLSWLVNLILPKDYELVQWLLIPCLGYPLLYTLSETTVVGINLVKKTNYILIATVIAFLVNLFLGLWLIPELGATGAAISTCISFWIFFILRTEFSNYVWRRFPCKKMYIYSTWLVFGATISGMYGPSHDILILMFWIITFMIALLDFIKDLRNIFLKIFNRSNSRI